MTGNTTHLPTPAIAVQGLTRKFGSTVALDDVTFEAQRGELIVLLGMSGSGKSTLMRHLNGLERPTSGRVSVLGQDLGGLTGARLRQIRSRIGFVFQQFELVGSLTVLENVLTGHLAELRGPRLGLWSYGKEAKLNALVQLDRVGLLSQSYQRADTLSGGQAQRVAIARALMQNPEILLADEPVASLDPESSHQVMELILEIGRERDLTVVCSLHQVDLALSWSKRLIGLRSGHIVLDAPTESVTRDEVMRLYGSSASRSEIAALSAVLNDMAAVPA